MAPRLDSITLEDITLDVIVGILDHERVHPQPLVLDLTLFLDLGPCGEHGDLALSVDYAAVLAQVRAVAEEGRWWLIESMAVALCRLLLAEPGASESRARIAQVDLRIRKPAILGGVAIPGVSMSRRAGELRCEPVPLGPGITGEPLVQPARGGAWRVAVAPEHALQLPADCAAMVLVGDFGEVGALDRVPRGGAVLRNIGEGQGLVLVLGSFAAAPLEG